MRARRHQPSPVESAAHADLVAAIGGGDLSGLGALFDRYADDVRRLLSRLGVSPGDVDDLVQETFLDVLRAAPRFRTDASVRAWLFGLGTMVARRHRRLVARIVRRLQCVMLERSAVRPPTPLEDLEVNAEARRVQRALDELSTRKREVLVLVALEGMRGEDVATALRIPVATVWTRLHHARRDLKRALSEGE